MSKNVFISGEDNAKPRPMRRIEDAVSPTTTRSFATTPRAIESPQTEGVGPAAASDAGQAGESEVDATASVSNPASPTAPTSPTSPASPASPASPTAPRPRAVFVSREHQRTGEVPRPTSSAPTTAGPALATPTPGSGSELQGMRPIQNRSEIRDLRPITDREASLRYDLVGMSEGQSRELGMAPGMDLSLTRVIVPDSMAPDGQALYQIESLIVGGRQALRPEYQAEGVATSQIVDASAEIAAKFFDLTVAPAGQPIVMRVRRLTANPTAFQAAVLGTRYVPPELPETAPPTQAPAPAPPPAPAAAAGGGVASGAAPASELPLPPSASEPF